MQLQDLQIYTKLYEQHSINRVARLMGFAQSNVTARLRALENEFNVRLFNRSYQGIAPTSNGQVFYKYAISVLKATEQVREKMFQNQSSPKRRVVMSTLLFNLLVTQQGKFSLAENTFDLLSSTAILQLTDETVDLVVTYANFQNPAFQQVSSHNLTALFLGCQQHEENEAPFLVNSDKHCPFRARTLRYLHQDMAAVQEIDSWDSIIGLVKAGKGIALLPDYLMAREDLVQIKQLPQFKVPYSTFVRTA
ncbi:LysR family transcriptional regulator [Secundilactobacillus folii]|uniref:LysR family transcriptional regulator n=1 Tax=Secundilactobacillus folii TaxID=2678357 RepID=A0A7X2XTH7_9LACO|nr:LysR family transcriptional regulator [Secundilactobacillus folii]MTV81382.1 LysR family transcriptional regulator [Secundilactobacillus folii]